MKVWTWKDGGYVTGWSTTKQDDSQIEMNQSDAELSRSTNPVAISSNARAERNSLLSTCDWTMLADAPLTVSQKESWQSYRQSLRDVPDQVGFPQNIVWPSSP